jgi:hypothetical protein
VNFTDPLGLIAGERAGGPNPDVVRIFPPTDEVFIDAGEVVGRRGGFAPIEAGAVYTPTGYSTGGEFNTDGQAEPETILVVARIKRNTSTRRPLPFPRRADPANPAQQPNGCTGVPDVFPRSCNAHDICYATVGVPMETCNYEFWENMKAERPDRRWVARIYYQGVIEKGASYYEDAQRRSYRYSRRRGI